MRAQRAKIRVLEAEGALPARFGPLRGGARKGATARYAHAMAKMYDLRLDFNHSPKGWSFSGNGRHRVNWEDFQRAQRLLIFKAKILIAELRRCASPQDYRLACEELRSQTRTCRAHCQQLFAETTQRRDDPYCYVYNAHAGLGLYMWGCVTNRLYYFSLSARLSIHRTEKKRCGDIRFYGSMYESIEQIWKLPKERRDSYLTQVVCQ